MQNGYRNHWKTSCYRYQRVHLANDKIQNICSLYGESDHVAAAGPNHIKIIQYLSCRTFAEMILK